MGDHRGGARTRAEGAREQVARVCIQVVGGLVEQQHLGLGQQRRADRKQRGLAAAHLTHGAVQAQPGQAKRPEHRERAVLY